MTISAAMIATMFLCSEAAADEGGAASSAESLFREGRDAVKRGDYAVACPKFQESQRLDPAIGTLLNLALCEERWGRISEARLHFREVLASSDLDEQRRAIALEHAAALDRIATEPVSPAPAPDSPAPTRAEPARSPPVASPAAPRDAEPERSASPHAAAYILGGLGLLSLTTCAVTGIMVIEKADTVDAHCPNKLCDDEGLAAASSGRTLSAVSTATFGVGLALTALSVYLLLQPSPSAPRSAIGVRGLRGGADLSWVGEF